MDRKLFSLTLKKLNHHEFYSFGPKVFNEEYTVYLFRDSAQSYRSRFNDCHRTHFRKRNFWRLRFDAAFDFNALPRFDSWTRQGLASLFAAKHRLPPNAARRDSFVFTINPLIRIDYLCCHLGRFLFRTAKRFKRTCDAFFDRNFHLRAFDYPLCGSLAFCRRFRRKSSSTV